MKYSGKFCIRENIVIFFFICFRNWATECRSLAKHYQQCFENCFPWVLRKILRRFRFFSFFFIQLPFVQVFANKTLILATVFQRVVKTAFCEPSESFSIFSHILCNQEQEKLWFQRKILAGLSKPFQRNFLKENFLLEKTMFFLSSSLIEEKTFKREREVLSTFIGIELRVLNRKIVCKTFCWRSYNLSKFFWTLTGKKCIWKKFFH